MNRWCAFWLALAASLPLLALGASPAAQKQAQRQSVQPGNNAPLWRGVKGAYAAHHEIWYHEVRSGKSRQHFAGQRP
jgi:hypothetical protein